MTKTIIQLADYLVLGGVFTPAIKSPNGDLAGLPLAQFRGASEYGRTQAGTAVVCEDPS